MERTLPIVYAKSHQSVESLYQLFLVKDSVKDLTMKNNFEVSTRSHFLRNGYFIENEYLLTLNQFVTKFVLRVSKSTYRIEVDNEEKLMSRYDNLQYILTVNGDVLMTVTIEELWKLINSNCDDFEIIYRIVKCENLQ